MKTKKIILFFLAFFFFAISFNASYAISNQELNLNCVSNIAINLEDGLILYDHNSNEKIYPASTTKILTAIITLENLNLQDTITITPQMIADIPYESSVMGIAENETYTVEDLLYGLLLVSGNDVAIALADEISTNMENFADLMNQKLQEIGCENTHFTNAHGYHDDNHYTTAYDMAKILQYALQNEDFMRIFSTKEKTVSPMNYPERVFKLENSNQMIYDSSEVYTPYMIAGKTGFTYEANGTFIGYAKKDDMSIIVGSFGGGLDENGNSARFSDTQKIINYIFDHYEKVLIGKQGDFPFSFDNLNLSERYLVGLANDSYIIAPKNYVLDYTVDIDSSVTNIEENTDIGTITLNFPNNDLKYSLALKVLQVSKKATFHFFTFLFPILMLIFLFLFLSYTHKKKQLRKKAYHKYKHQKLYQAKTRQSLRF